MTTTPTSAPATGAARTAHQLDAQRRAALDKANATRAARADLVYKIKVLPPQRGAARAARVLVELPDYAATMKLQRLICAINGFGPGRARKLAPFSRHKPLNRIRAAERADLAAAIVHRARHYAPRRLPLPMDADQRDRAHDSAQRIRIARAHARRVITGGGSDPREAAMRAARLIAGWRSDPDLAGMTVAAVITAIPDYGEVHAHKLLEALALTPDITLEALGSERAERLAIHLATARPLRRRTPLAAAA